MCGRSCFAGQHCRHSLSNCYVIEVFVFTLSSVKGKSQLPVTSKLCFLFFCCWLTVLLHKVLSLPKCVHLLSTALSSGFQGPDSISVAFVKNVDCSFMND